MSTRLDAELLGRLEVATKALHDEDLRTLASLVPPREHWRLYGHFAPSAVFFDIEADAANTPTVVGLMDRHGVASYRHDGALDELPERLAESPVWVSFNGSVFDAPALEAWFGARFPRPLVHIDLRFLVRHARLKGGLKGIERTLGLGRPPHLEGLRGFDAIRLWREWTERRELAALRILVEYNLYDAVNLRSVLEWTAWRIAELNAWTGVTPAPIFQRGDVLYDVSRLVLNLPD